MTLTASEARRRFFPLAEQVIENREAVQISTKHGEVVLLSGADYDALQETAYLLRAPANARHLLESLAQARAGRREERELA